MLGLATLPASALPSPYQCVNESIDIDIRPQDADVAGRRSNGVQGTYTSAEALAALVEGQGLTAESIRQGLSVTSAEEDRADTSDIDCDCQNDALPVAIGAMRLDDALAELSHQTRCPISKDFETGGLRSRTINRTMTPVIALKAILQGTGLKGQQIKPRLAVLPRRG